MIDRAFALRICKVDEITQIVKTAPLVIAETPKYIYLLLAVEWKGDNSERTRTKDQSIIFKGENRVFLEMCPFGHKKKVGISWINSHSRQ